MGTAVPHRIVDRSRETAGAGGDAGELGAVVRGDLPLRRLAERVGLG